MVRGQGLDGKHMSAVLYVSLKIPPVLYWHTLREEEVRMYLLAYWPV